MPLYYLFDLVVRGEVDLVVLEYNLASFGFTCLVKLWICP